MKKKKKTILALSICFLFINILPNNIFFGSSLHTNNKTIMALPLTSNINIYEWHKTWNGYSDGSCDDCGRGIALDGSGNAFITGFRGTMNRDSKDPFLLKYDSSGNLLWYKIIEDYINDYGKGIALDGSGNIFITGSISKGLPFMLIGDRDTFLVKYSSSGNLLWHKRWGGPCDDCGCGIALDGSGNAFITGYTYSYGAGQSNALLLKFDNSGNLLWNKTWGGSDDDGGYGIALDALGNAFITGSTYSYGAGNDDAFLLKYDSSGNLQWNKTWGGSDNEYGHGIALDALGNAFITGYTGSYGAGNDDAFLLKYNSSGNLLWYKTWGGSARDYGWGIALDNSGNIFITGSIYKEAEYDHDDVFLLKFGIDTDGDGYTDGEEVNSGTDPLNFFDNWLSRGVIIFVILSSSITVLIVFYVFKRKKKVNQKNVIIKKGDT